MNNDLISRKALLEGFDVHKVTEYDESGCGVDYRAVSVDAIMKAPAVDAEPVRHGAWSIKETCHGSMDDDGWWVEWSAICPECGMVVCLDPVSCECGMLKDALAEYNYCSKCGAKMDGGDDGE